MDENKFDVFSFQREPTAVIYFENYTDKLKSQITDLDFIYFSYQEQAKNLRTGIYGEP